MTPQREEETVNAFVKLNGWDNYERMEVVDTRNDREHTGNLTDGGVRIYQSIRESPVTSENVMKKIASMLVTGKDKEKIIEGISGQPFGKAYNIIKDVAGKEVANKFKQDYEGVTVERHIPEHKVEDILLI